MEERDGRAEKLTHNDRGTMIVHNSQTCSHTVYGNFGICGGDSVTRLQSIVTVTEGEDVSLQCNYTVANTGSDSLFWYRHLTSKAPEYILSTSNNNRIKDHAEFATERFSTNVFQVERTAPLNIFQVRVTDSAGYYCALSRTENIPVLLTVTLRCPGLTVSPSGERMSLLCVSISFLFLQYVFSASVKQTPSAMRKQECEAVTINCIFEAESYETFSKMEFYRKFPNERDWKRIPLEARFVVKIDKESMSSSLEIHDLQVQDSADYTCLSRGDYVTHSVPSVTETEGGQVTLDSNYATTLSDYCLYWYRQLSEKQPEYILRSCLSRGDYVTHSVPSVTETEGGQVTLDSNYATTLSDYCLYWYRQLSEKQPEYILRSYVFSASVKQTPSSLRKEECDSLTISCVFEEGYYDTFINIEFPMQFGKGSRFTVSQSPPEQTAFAGERIHLHCQYSGFWGQDFSVSWYRQSPGEGLKYLLHRKPSGEGGNPTGDHISASLDTAKKISVLTIADLRLTDSAMYHCALSLHHSDTHHRKPRTITLITTKAGNQYSTVSDIQ
eukprot:gi/632984879/ref/XP_007909367.1/ PREDICTED: uncharacterized protein LOC103190412 [Callorhinchus milii]